ncbi:MAG: hypothetical protein AAGK78_02605 [Planctomycetota bacterium]
MNDDELLQRKQHILGEALRAATGRRRRRRTVRVATVGVYVLGAFGLVWAIWPANSSEPPVVLDMTPQPKQTVLDDEPKKLQYVSLIETKRTPRHTAVLSESPRAERYVQVLDTYEMYAALTQAGVAADVAILGDRPHLVLYKTDDNSR